MINDSTCKRYETSSDSSSISSSSRSKKRKYDEAGFTNEWDLHRSMKKLMLNPPDEEMKLI